MFLDKDLLLELVRYAYLQGGYDQQEDNFYWCNQGSLERAEDLLNDWLEDNMNKQNAQLHLVAAKLSELKQTLNDFHAGLSLEEYDILHGDIEELQYLVDEIIQN